MFTGSWDDTLQLVADSLKTLPFDGSWHVIEKFEIEAKARSVAECPTWTASVWTALHYEHGSEFPHWVMAKRRKVKDDDVVGSPEDRYGTDAVALCEFMAPLIVENGYAVTSHKTHAWLHHAKLIFDRAAEMGKSPESVFALAEWALKDEFWCSNIRSTQKLHKHYDLLREQANKAHGKGSMTFNQTAWERTRASTNKIWEDLDID